MPPIPITFSDTTPAAPGTDINVKWQTDGSGNLSAHVPAGGGGSGAPNGTLVAYGPPNPITGGPPAYNYANAFNGYFINYGNASTVFRSSAASGSLPPCYKMATTASTPASYSWFGSYSQETIVPDLLARIQHYFALAQTTACRVWCGVGFANGSTLETPTPTQNMIAFRYDAAVDTHWQAFAYNNGTAMNTVVDTGVTPDTNFHQFAIQPDGSGGFNFYIDGTKVANIPFSSGNIPPASSGLMGDLIQIDADGVSGAAVALYIVSMQMWYVY